MGLETFPVESAQQDIQANTQQEGGYALHIDRAGKRKWGYSVEQVDEFFQYAHESYNAQPPLLTQEDIQHVSFELERNGYLIEDVDAKLVRLEHAIVDKHTQWQITHDGFDTWVRAVNELANTLIARMQRPLGERFERGTGKHFSYDCKQVDSLVDMARMKITMALSSLQGKNLQVDDDFTRNSADSNDITARHVANVLFTQQRGKRGYSEHVVDNYLNRIVQVLTLLESYDRLKGLVDDMQQVETMRKQQAESDKLASSQVSVQSTPLIAVNTTNVAANAAEDLHRGAYVGQRAEATMPAAPSQKQFSYNAANSGISVPPSVPDMTSGTQYPESVQQTPSAPYATSQYAGLANLAAGDTPEFTPKSSLVSSFAEKRDATGQTFAPSADPAGNVARPVPSAPQNSVNSSIINSAAPSARAASVPAETVQSTPKPVGLAHLAQQTTAAKPEAIIPDTEHTIVMNNGIAQPVQPPTFAPQSMPVSQASSAIPVETHEPAQGQNHVSYDAVPAVNAVENAFAGSAHTVESVTPSTPVSSAQSVLNASTRPVQEPRYGESQNSHATTAFTTEAPRQDSQSFIQASQYANNAVNADNNVLLNNLHNDNLQSANNIEESQGNESSKHANPDSYFATLMESNFTTTDFEIPSLTLPSTLDDASKKK